MSLFQRPSLETQLRPSYCCSLQPLVTRGSHPLCLQAVTVYECLSEWGQILCAVCPNPKLVITGGTSTVVCVWEMGTSKEKAKPLTLKQVTAAWLGWVQSCSATRLQRLQKASLGQSHSRLSRQSQNTLR